MTIRAGQRDNYSGDQSLTAPTGGVVKGNLYLIGSSYWVARETKSAGAAFLAANPAVGAVWANKATGTGKSFAAGAKLYVKTAVLDVAASTGSSLVLGGVAALEAAATADAEVLIGAATLTANGT